MIDQSIKNGEKRHPTFTSSQEADGQSRDDPASHFLSPAQFRHLLRAEQGINERDGWKK
jgi:hypothetical protein